VFFEMQGGTVAKPGRGLATSLGAGRIKCLGPSGGGGNFFFFWGGGVQQIPLRTEDRKKRDLGAVAP